MKDMHSYGWLDQPPFLFGSAKNIEHLALCCVGASAQSHNCSVSARVQMHPRLRPAMCIVLCIIVCQISHVKHQLLIQRLVLFFYPHGGSKALAARAFPDIFPERYPKPASFFIMKTAAEGKIALRTCLFYPTFVKMA